MSGMDINGITVWTNMLRTDDKENGYRAVPMFKDPSILQDFDSENIFGIWLLKT